MSEGVAVTGIGDYFSRRGVDVAHPPAWFHRRDPGELRFQHDAIDLAELGWDATDEDHAGQIAAITANPRAPVEKNGAAAFHLAKAGVGVRDGGVGAFSADGGEGRGRGPAALHFVLQP